MAKWSVSNKSFTPVPVGDTASFTDNGYLAVQGAASTQRIKIIEIYMGGQATAQAPMIMEFARDSIERPTGGGCFYDQAAAFFYVVSPPAYLQCFWRRCQMGSG
jgi:hypothetical protein